MRLRRRHVLHLAGRGPETSVLRGRLRRQIIVIVRLVVLQAQIVRGRAQQLMVVELVQVLVGRLLRVSFGRLLEILVVTAAKVVVPEVSEVLVLMPVDAGVLVVVRQLARVTVLVRHFAAVLVIVHYLAGMDQRYALAGQLVRVHVVHVLRHFLGHDNDYPVVSAQNEKRVRRSDTSMYCTGSPRMFVFRYISAHSRFSVSKRRRNSFVFIRKWYARDHVIDNNWQTKT